MPIPSRLWFPQALADILLWFNAFNDQVQLTGTTHGLTVIEVARVQADRDMVEFLVTSNTTINDWVETMRSFRKSIMEDAADGSTPPVPATITLTPAAAVPKGIFERVIEYSNRIKASPGYNEFIGESYGIVGTSPAPISPSEVEPEISLSAAVHGYLFSVVVSKREDADAWEVWAKPGLATEFQLVKTATGKSTDVVFNPGGDVPGPVVLEVYVQLKRNNENYGQPSATRNVTVNP